MWQRQQQQPRLEHLPWGITHDQLPTSRTYVNSFHDYESVSVSKMNKIPLKTAIENKKFTKEVQYIFENILISLRSAFKVNWFLTHSIAIEAEGLLPSVNDVPRREFPQEINDDLYNGVAESLKYIYFEWSDAGIDERNFSVNVILNAICDIYPPLMTRTIYIYNRFDLAQGDDCFIMNHGSTGYRSRIKVLIPNFHLGRLVYELAAQKFNVTGIENNYQMLIATIRLFELCRDGRQFKLFPWIDLSLKDLDIHNILGECVVVPDQQGFNLAKSVVTPVILQRGNIFSKFSLPDLFDVVATSFLSDYDYTVLEYIQHIHHILVRKGHWINIGPLKGKEPFFTINYREPKEMPYASVRPLLLQNGFVIIQENTQIKAPHLCRFPDIQLDNHHTTIFFVAMKL